MSINEQIETVIIGAGHTGLVMSYYLRQLGREHIILERGRVGEKWVSERWDSFFFQFPNWTIELPGYKYECNDPDGFAPRTEIIRFVQDYAGFIKAPVRSGVEVTSLQRLGSGRYRIETPISTIEAANVVIATGAHQQASIPQLSVAIPKDVFQIHSSRYRNADQLPPGAVLVVGAGSSGCQIAEDLNESARNVYHSVGRHLRVPRRYRGRDYAYWRFVMGGWDRTVDSLPPGAKNLPVPLLTGFAGGHDVDFCRMAAAGITLLGRLENLRDGTLIYAPDLQQNLTKGEDWFKNSQISVDGYIKKTGLDVPHDDYHDAEAKHIFRPISELDVKAAGITSIIWATGFRYDFDWVKLPLFNHTAEPEHRRGVTNSPGIYFLGLRWLYKLKSAFLLGAGPAEDAAYLAEMIQSGAKRR